MTTAVNPRVAAADKLLAAVDPEILAAIRQERRRQRDQIELIASENYTSAAVLVAQGSVLTNKYAEGLPSARYYGGCEYVDVAETLAIERATKLFGADHANVQPHSGAQANAAAYMALLNYGDTVLGMKLDHGGHLSHGAKFNFSGKLYNFVSYGVDPDSEQIDYDKLAELAEEHRPRLILAGGSAYPRIIDFPRLREIADAVGAYLMMDMAHIAGLVAAGYHPNPVPYCDIVTTTTHKTLRGARGGMILARAEHGRKVDKAVFPGQQGGPLMHAIAGKAVAFAEALKPEFKTYQQAVIENAQVLAETLTAGGLRLVSGGTDNHLLLVDLRPLSLTGNVAEDVLHQAGITINMNMIPFDSGSSRTPSGIRLGTPAMTTRGVRAAEMRLIGESILRALKHHDDSGVLAEVRATTYELCQRFPVPGLEGTLV